MNDPFAIQQASVGAAREGMDAPDLQVRIAQLKAQQGQQLTEEENRRLGVRMGLESEAARQDVSRGLSGGDTMFGPRSTSVYEGLRGSRLDPVLAGARVEAARLESNPTYRALAEDQAQLTRIGHGDLVAGTPLASDILVNYEGGRQNAIRKGIPIQEELAGQAVYKPTAVIESKAFAPAEAAAAAPVTKTSPTSRAAAKLQATTKPTIELKNLSGYLRNEAEREIQRQGRTVSVNTAARIRSETSAALTPQETEITTNDDLTGNSYSVKVLKNSRGEVFSVGEPVLTKANPVTLKADEVFVDEYNKWVTTDAITASSDIAVLRELSKNLPSMTMVSGFMTGIINKAGVQSYLLPGKSADAAETIRGIAQRSAKATLGSAYTAAEGKALMEKAFDPALSPEINASRAARMATALEKAAAAKQAKADYLSNMGTTAGYKPYSMADLEKDMLGDTATNTAQGKVATAADNYRQKKAGAATAAK